MTQPEKRLLGIHAGKWTEERIKEALEYLYDGMSLSQAAREMGISRAALTNALERHGVKPKRVWI